MTRRRRLLPASLAIALLGPSALADDTPEQPVDLGAYREAEPTTKPVAPPPEETHKEGEYGGVVPGKPPAAVATKRKVRIPSKPTVTWIGFMELESGSSRVFLQLSTDATPQQSLVGGELVVTLSEFALAPSNNTRPLETEFFKTSVARVGAKAARTKGKGKKSSRTVEVRVQFKNAADARQADAHVEKAQDGYHYLYLDFGPPSAAPSSGT